MTSLADRLEQIKAGAAQDAKKYGPLEEKLLEFAAELQRVFDIYAEIVPGDRPEMRHLVTGPRYLRFENSMMLSFWFDGDGVKVFGEEPQTYRDPQSLEDFLVEFVSDSAFRHAIHIYNQRDAEDVYCFLRQRTPFEPYAGDLLSVVSNEDHRRLVDAQVGAKLIVDVLLNDATNWSDASLFQFLVSAGHVLKIGEQGIDASMLPRVKVSGTKIEPFPGRWK